MDRVQQRRLWDAHRELLQLAVELDNAGKSTEAQRIAQASLVVESAYRALCGGHVPTVEPRP